MRIVCIGDTHGFHRQLAMPDGNILIHAGDFMVDGRFAEEIAEFNAWLGELPYRYRIVIAGNHDLLFESDPPFARGLLSNAIYLENSGVVLEGLSFWGSPVTPVVSHMAFAVARGAPSRKYWDRIPSDTDVLITHGPPFGILDKENILAPHDGCHELAKAVQRIRPKLHIFGHIHGDHGREVGPNGTQFINCAAMNGSTLREPLVIELEAKPRVDTNES